MQWLLKWLRNLPALVRLTFKALPLWSKYLLAAAVLSAVTACYVWYWGLGQRIVTGLIASSKEYGESLWFLPDGALLGAMQVDSGIIVSIWKPENGSLVRQSKYFSLATSREYINRSVNRDGPEIRQLPENVAIARDGSRLAHLLYGYLVVVSDTSGRPIDEIDLGRSLTESPSALAFTDTGLVALAYPNGKIELRDPNNLTQVVGSAQTNLNTPSIMKPLGNFLAVVSAVNAAVVMLDMRSLTKQTALRGYPASPLENFTLAISDKGRLAIATGESRVVVYPIDGSGEGSIALDTYGRVKILAFYDDDRVLAGGDFDDLYLLSQGGIPERVLIADGGVKALAANGNRIAYAGPAGISLVWHTKTRYLSTSGKVALAILGIVLLGLAGLFAFDKRKQLRAQTDSAIATTQDVEDDHSTEPKLPIPEPPDALIKACREGECVLYGGAGLSAQAGFPIWPSFVEGLTEWVITNGFVEKNFAISLQAALKQGQYDSVADNIVSTMRTREKTLNAYLQKIFLQSASLPSSHQLLKKMPFSAVLTTNFDSLLEDTYRSREAAVYTPKDSEQLLQCLTKRDFFLLKLYGSLDRPDTVMIAPAQYDDVIRRSLLFSQFMETLFFSRTLLFVGSSLEGIEAYLKGIAFTRQNLRKHYALVAVTGEAWQTKANPLQERYGIEVLPFSPTEGFPEVQVFLERLEKKVRAETERTKDEVGPTRALKKIVLSDIGPFEETAIEFDAHWNILLGDNGVGKSSILKAIAVAILGEDAKSYAGRLIKSGNTDGVITLVTERNTYTTKLFRKNGEAKVESIPGRAFEAEGWLAVGFPPLRTVSWERPKAPEAEAKGRPTLDDLIPLVTGAADPRLDKLKQWIVNLDYWIKDARSRNADPGRYQRLLKEFFDVVGQLSKGLKIEFVEVKPHTNEVTIRTDDGELPLESLSQGMTSLIGWVGILLQRLYEVYGDDEDPKQRYALVLMDEIDAHMHPSWQQSLVHELGKIFPNVQFIATTHSPLIVGGLRPEQIIRFARNDEHEVVQFVVEEEMTLGRTDQILTGDLFGLQTTFTLNDELQKVMQEYHELLAKNSRNGSEEIKFQRLRESLKTRIPLAAENPPERRAMELLKALLKDEGNGKYETVHRNLMEKAEKLLDEVLKKKKS